MPRKAAGREGTGPDLLSRDPLATLGNVIGGGEARGQEVQVGP